MTLADAHFLFLANLLASNPLPSLLPSELTQFFCELRILAWFFNFRKVSPVSRGGKMRAYT